MDRRMAGDYEVIHAFHIGDKEIVIGENIEADDDERYMCAFCEKNEIMERYKMIAESYLGKETIDMNTYGKSSGRSGNYSTNWQITGRELLDAAEVRMLDNRYALLFIRGEMPVMDEKYDLLNHPNVKYTPEKGGAPYVHGGTELSVASLSLSTVSTTETRFVNLSEIEFELLSDEEIEAELLSGGNTNEEHL